MSMIKFPAHRAHLGVWEGTYRHIDLAAQEEELIQSHVVCEFPETDVFYRQTIKLTHADGSITEHCHPNDGHHHEDAAQGNPEAIDRHVG